MLINDLLQCDYDELIDIIMSMQDYIGTLESEIQRLKQERTDKITKDFEDNKKMVAKILTNLCI